MVRPPRTGRPTLRSQAGMVTAETAVVLPVLLAVLAGAIAAVTVVGAQMRCVDAAREGARAAARGEGVGTVTDLVRTAAPEGARVEIVDGDGRVRVTVSARIVPLGPLPLTVRVTADAVAQQEPGSTGSPG